MSRQLKDLSLDEWGALENGDHNFAISGQPVRLRLRSAGRGLRHACFDLVGTSKEICPQALEQFRMKWEKDLRSHGGAVDWREVITANGKSYLEFSVVRGEEGEWLYCAAQFLSDPNNLVELRFS